MLKIRLRRMGSKHAPFYRVVVSDSRKTPRSRAVEVLGFYDPRAEPKMVNIDHERVNHWVSTGAQPSKTVQDLIAVGNTVPVEAAAE